MQSGEAGDPPRPKAAADSYEVFLGPSYLDGLPDQEEWRAFNKYIQDPASLAFAGLWQEKAAAANGIPLRKDFGFRELVKYGSHLALYRLTEDNRWLTTFCGDIIVQNVGIELTGKCIDEYADKDTLEFWMENIKFICEQGKPIVEFYSLEHAGKDYSVCHSLNLPLRSGTHDFSDMFICHDIYTKRSNGRSSAIRV